jgi:hypothetical protein
MIHDSNGRTLKAPIESENPNVAWTWIDSVFRLQDLYQDVTNSLTQFEGYSKILIWLGTNYLKKGELDGWTLYKKTEWIVNRLRETGAEVLVFKVPYINNNNEPATFHRITYNLAITKNLPNIPYEFPNTEPYMKDNIHISPKAATVVAKAIATNLYIDKRTVINRGDTIRITMENKEHKGNNIKSGRRGNHIKPR